MNKRSFVKALEISAGLIFSFQAICALNAQDNAKSSLLTPTPAAETEVKAEEEMITVSASEWSALQQDVAAVKKQLADDKLKAELKKAEED
ncbi:MAG: hypothetical protein ACI4UF_03705 [Thermoguttaceae bacterium]